MTIPLPKPISPQALREWLVTDDEIALIDVREEGAYSEGHLFHASCLPASRIELLLSDRLPRRDGTIVLTGGSNADLPLVLGVAALLGKAGYVDVRMLAGGAQAWAQAGYELFTGVNVPSKAFGEFVEHWHETPRLPAADVYAMQTRGERCVILDSRPFDEFTRMSIPGGVDCPGAELVYRVHQQVPDDTTPIIVNCAGRTRSIIGAQSLINAGVPNPIYALKDGTMGWKLAGLVLAHGETASVAMPSSAALARSRERALAVMQQHGVQTISAEELAVWLADPTRTTRILDVRTAEEYRHGHWLGAMHAPGGQLVQATDEYVAVRNARLVLADSADGVRATMTAHWLAQQGWLQVRVLTDQPGEPETGSREDAGLAGLGLPDLMAGRTLNADSLAALLAAASPPAVLDFGSSTAYQRRGHVPGACWAVRARLAECIAACDDHHDWVLVADDERLAHLAAATLRALRRDDTIRVLTGGTPGWITAGHELTRDNLRWLTTVDDVWVKPYDGGDPKEAMQAYLAWEVGLVAQVEREGLARFRRTG